MSFLDWVVIALLLPHIFFKSTRVAALVLFFVFPFYTWAITLQHEIIKSGVIDSHMLKYMIFGIIDSCVSLALITYYKVYRMNKGDLYIACLALLAVTLHFTRWYLREKGIDLPFYKEGCIVIVFLQVISLYWRLLFNGRLFKDFLRDSLFLLFDRVSTKQSVRMQKKENNIIKGKL